MVCRAESGSLREVSATVGPPLRMGSGGVALEETTVKFTRPGLGVLGFLVAPVAYFAGAAGDRPSPAAEPRSTAERSTPTVVRMTAPMPDAPVAAMERDAAAPAAPYLPGRAMVRLQAGADAARVAARHGAQVIRGAGPSGWVLLGASGETDHAELVASLASDRDVRASGPVARIQGAGKPTKSSTTDVSSVEEPAATDDGTTDSVSSSPSPARGQASWDSAETSDPCGAPTAQWHLSEVCAPAHPDLSGVTVAVLDSGAAYATEELEGRSFVQAEALAGVPIVAPRDFVDGDDKPFDEHQHGTHIATILVGDGAVKGVAAGAALMPLRVLDEHNAGDELALVDAIYWAADHGAQVLNMSLSFPPGYVPSSALQRALRHAHDKGITMVAAAGNNGRHDVVTWPAASPLVIAVGAYYESAQGHDEPTAYTNLGPAVDLMAPGGRLDVDADRDGLVDGILGESFAVGQPADMGYWMMAGTSQAAAIVSGAVAHLLAGGAMPAQVRAALQHGATDWGVHSASEGQGAGGLDVKASLAEVGAPGGAGAEGLHVAVLPYAVSSGGTGPSATVGSRFEVTLVDSRGEFPVGDYSIQGTIWSVDGPQVVECMIVRDSACLLESELQPRFDADGAERPLAWALQVDAVIDYERIVTERPGSAMFGSDGLEILLHGIHDHPTLTDAPLAVHWAEEPDSVLGRLTESYAMVNTGSGLATSPMGLVALPSAMSVSTKAYTVDLDGTGLATSPLGVISLQKLVFDGTGLATSPLGFHSLTMLAFDGTGLATSPLGLTAMDVFAPGGGQLDAGLGLNGSTVLLGEAMLVGESADGTLLAEHVATGGWTTESDYDLATLLAGSGAIDVGMVAEGDAIATGTAGVEVTP